MEKSSKNIVVLSTNSDLDENFYPTEPLEMTEWSFGERLDCIGECLKSDSDVGTKLQALEELQTYVLQISNKPLLRKELERVLNVVDCALNDTNFQILQGGLEILESLAQSLPVSLKSHLNVIVSMIVPKMGGKYVVRQSLTKISLALMECTGPNAVISELMSSGFKHKSSKVREDVINIIITTLLKYPRTEINLLDVAKRLAPSLVDGRQRVRQAALEAFAVLAHALGKGNVQPLVSAVASVEQSYCQEVRQDNKPCGLMAAFQARLSRHQLPSINSDGLVEHAVQVSIGLTSAGKARSVIGDDVDWILQGSVSTYPHQNSPTGDGSGSRVSSGVRPYQSATRNKLPWEKEHSDSSPQKSKKLASIPPKPKKSLPPSFVSSGGNSKRSTTNSYAELHRARLRRMNIEQNQLRPNFKYPTSVVPLSNGELIDTTSTTHSSTSPSHFDMPATSGWLLSSLQGLSTPDNSSAHNSGLSLTWPAPNPDCMESSSPVVVGGSHSQRPASKPRVKHPLSGVKPKSLSTSDAPECDDIRSSPSRRVDTYNDDFEDIYEDDFEGNSLSSSISSLAVKELKEAASRLQKDGMEYSPDDNLRSSVSDAPPDGCGQGYLAQRTLNKLEKEKLKVKTAKVRSGVGKHVKEESLKVATSSESSQDDDLHGESQPHTQLDSGRYSLKKHDSFVINWAVPHENTSNVVLSKEGDSRFKPSSTQGKSKTPDVSPVTHKKTVSLSKSAKGRILNQKLKPLEGDVQLGPKRQGPIPHKPPQSTESAQIVPHPADEQNTPCTNGDLPVDHQPPRTQGLVTPSAETERSTVVSLQPLPNPEQVMKDSLQAVSSENWETKVEAMLNIRRLSFHHCETLLSQLTPVLLAVTAEVKNLRSAVSKAAIECLGDMFQSLKFSMEPHLEIVVKVLLHRTGGANSFLREASEEALHQMVLHVNPHKSLVSLVTGGVSHKNVTIRRTTAQFICEGVELMGGMKFLSSPKEVLETVIPAIAKMLGDNSSEARYYCRRALNELIGCSEFDKVVAKLASPQVAKQLEKAINQLKKKGVGDYPRDPHSARSRTSSRPPSGSVSAGVADKRTRHISQQNTPVVKSGKIVNKKRQRSLSDAQVPLAPGSTLSTAISQLTSSEWSERYKAITDLEELVKLNPLAIVPHSLKVFNAFTPRLSDPNVKVNLHALEAFSNMIPLLGNHLSSVVWSVLSSLPINSKLPGIAPAAGVVLDLMCEHIELTHLVQPLTNLAEFTNSKAQTIFITKINELLPLLCQTTPTRVQQHVLPLAWHLLEKRYCTNLDLTPAIRSLCLGLYQAMGKTLLDKASTLPQESLSRLHGFIANS